MLQRSRLMQSTGMCRLGSSSPGAAFPSLALLLGSAPLLATWPAAPAAALSAAAILASGA